MALRVYWYQSPRIIEIPAPQTEITIQDLTDQIKDIEDEPANLAFPILVKTFGKQPLGGGVYVGITAELQNAQVAFESRAPGPDTVQCVISGGNLVAIDINGDPMSPIYPTPFTQVTLAQSSSATIATPPSEYGLLHMIESLRGHHTSVGNIWYWAPVGGNDVNDGTTPSNAVATFAKAQTLASSGTSDIIFALSTDSGGVVSTTEKITIVKNNLKVRGTGYGFQFTPDSTGTPTVNITANNVEFSGFYITTDTGGTDNGVTVTGDNALIKDVWVKSATGDGINVSSSSRTTIDTCAIEDCAGNGVAIGADTTIAKIRNCIISGSTAADGVDLTGTGITDNILENNLIFNNTGWGIDVNASATRTGIRLHHTIAKNTAGSIETTGSTDTFQDTSGTITPGDITAIVEGVWDELLSAHTDPGSAGKTLRDAKVKATLASLKG